MPKVIIAKLEMAKKKCLQHCNHIQEIWLLSSFNKKGWEGNNKEVEDTITSAP